MDPYSLRFDPIPEPSIEKGDAVTVQFTDGTRRSLLVTDTEPMFDEEGRAGQRITFLGWPE